MRVPKHIYSVQSVQLDYSLENVFCHDEFVCPQDFPSSALSNAHDLLHFGNFYSSSSGDLGTGFAVKCIDIIYILSMGFLEESYNP